MGYKVSYTGTDGERHRTRKTWKTKGLARKWANGCPPGWRATVVKVRRD